MPEISIWTFVILCPILFLAAFVDSAAGGGGLISLPGYFFAGFPMLNAYGTNKFTAGMGATFSSVQYLKSKKVDLKPTLAACVTSLLGSFTGTRLAILLGNQILQLIMLILLPTAGVSILILQAKKKTKDEGFFVPDEKRVFRAVFIGLLMGFYDGFFGPGTGTFLILLLNGALGMELVIACGSARVINMSSNIASMITYIINGKVVWAVIIPCMLCSILGGQLGTRLAIKNGAKFVRPIIVIMIVLLMTKVVYDFASGNT